MKTTDLAPMKAAIKKELARRNGFGDVSEYAEAKYDLSKQPTIGEKIRPEYGEKTIDLLLHICDYKDLKKVKLNGPVPAAFGPELTDFVQNT